MTEHIKQKGDTCLLASVCAAACRDGDFYKAYLQKYPRSALGGQCLGDLMPILTLNNKYVGLVIGFSTDPVYDDGRKTKQAVSLNKVLVENIKILAEKQQKSLEGYIENHLSELVAASDCLPVEMNYDEENGLGGENVNPVKIKGFNLYVPIENPAIVAVNTNGKTGHAVYWDGTTLYDPDKDTLQNDFEGYSIKTWIPISESDYSLDQLEYLIKDRHAFNTYKKNIENHEKTEVLEMSDQQNVKIELLKDKFAVRDTDGHMHNAEIGAIHEVSIKDGKYLADLGKARIVSDQFQFFVLGNDTAIKPLQKQDFQRKAR